MLTVLLLSLGSINVNRHKETTYKHYVISLKAHVSKQNKLSNIGYDDRRRIMQSFAGTYDEDNEYSGSMKGGEYLDKL
jgi:predicted Zn-dependent protease